MTSHENAIVTAKWPFWLNLHMDIDVANLAEARTLLHTLERRIRQLDTEVRGLDALRQTLIEEWEQLLTDIELLKEYLL